MILIFLLFFILGEGILILYFYVIIGVFVMFLLVVIVVIFFKVRWKLINFYYKYFIDDVKLNI